jgi:uncharacterized membrane protein YgcG
MIKLYSLTIPLMVTGMLLSAAQTNAQTAATMQKPLSAVKIDGTTSEWGGTLAMYDSNSKLSYSIANDDSCIYVVATSVDKITKRKILMAGITVSINTEGKKKKTYSVTYPEAGTAGFMRGDDNGAPPPPPTIKLSGFKGLQSSIPSVTNPFGFKGAFKFDDDRNLGYELAIPIKLLALKPGTDLFINIAINGVDMERPKSNGVEQPAIPGRGGRSGGSSGGGRGSSGGSAGGGFGSGGGGGASDDSGFAETQDFWVRVTVPVH